MPVCRRSMGGTGTPRTPTRACGLQRGSQSVAMLPPPPVVVVDAARCGPVIRGNGFTRQLEGSVVHTRHGQRSICKSFRMISQDVVLIFLSSYCGKTCLKYHCQTIPGAGTLSSRDSPAASANRPFHVRAPRDWGTNRAPRRLCRCGFGLRGWQAGPRWKVGAVGAQRGR